MLAKRREGSEERLSPLAEQWPYLRFLGMGSWWAWIWLCYNTTEVMRWFPVDEQPLWVLFMYLFSTLGIATAMLVAAAFWKRVTPFVNNEAVIIGFGGFASIATVTLGFSGLIGGGVLFVLAAIFTGVGTSFLCLRVGLVFGSVSLGDSLTAGAISLLFSSLLYFVGIGLPVEWRIFYIAALPTVSALLLTMAENDPYPSAMPTEGDSLDRHDLIHRVYRRLVLASALVALTAGVGKGISSSLVAYEAFAREGSIIVFSIGLIAVGIVWAVNRMDITKGTKQVYTALIMLGVAMMLASCFGFDIAYLSIGKEALWLIFSCLITYMTFRFDLSPIRFFGIGQAVYFLASTAGWALGGAIAPYYGDIVVRTGVGVVLGFLIIVVLMYVFTDADIKAIAKWTDRIEMKESIEQRRQVPQKELASGPDTSVQQTDPLMESINPALGLSQREIEILLLFAQGRSANWIADHLTISKNTVRSHLRAIYVKCDVHTRQDLLDMLKIHTKD